jgi:hypothetical protein
MDARSPRRLISLLLLVPYVGLLWVPFYNARTPALWGFSILLLVSVDLGADHGGIDVARVPERAP